MREIKFRGKTGTIKGNKWVYGYLYKVKSFLDNSYKYYIKNEHLQDFIVEEETIGQFTGLYDKNNIPIYEGDIINNKNILEDVNYEVIYDKGAFYGKRKNYWYPEENVFLKLYMVDREDIEVRGNIFDNKENNNER